MFLQVQAKHHSQELRKLYQLLTQTPSETCLKNMDNSTIQWTEPSPQVPPPATPPIASQPNPLNYSPRPHQHHKSHSPPNQTTPPHILKRPHNAVRHPLPNMSVPLNTPPPPLNSNPSNYINNCQLTDSKTETLNDSSNEKILPPSNIHSQQSSIITNKPIEKHVPTVSALSTGPEVDLADLNQKALLSSKPMSAVPSIQSPVNKKKGRSNSSNGPPKPNECLNNINTSSPPPPLASNNYAPTSNTVPTLNHNDSQSKENLYPCPPNTLDNYEPVENCDTFTLDEQELNESHSTHGNVELESEVATFSKKYRPILLKHTEIDADGSKRTKRIAKVTKKRIKNLQTNQTLKSSEETLQLVLPDHLSTVNEETTDYETDLEVLEAEEVTVEVKDQIVQTLPSTLNLKHTYLPDQWSPLNQDGSKKYSRDFLCSIQYDTLSKKKPDNLPDFEVVLKDFSKPISFKNHIPVGMLNQSKINTTFTPYYLDKSPSSLRGIRQLPSKRCTPNLSKSTKLSNTPKAPSSPNIVLSISLKEEVKLRETKNAWRPNKSSDEDAQLYQEVRGILNKLTPQNFESLVQKFKTFALNNKTRLEKVIDLVFQKAVSEPSFSEFYARLCYEMMKMEVIDETKPLNKDGKPQSVNFKGLLLDKCQHEFEKNKSDERDADKFLELIDQEPDIERRKELKSDFEEKERLLRKRSVGNCRFIGELYKLNMLTSKIMHYCIQGLLAKIEEEPLECTCKLLSTIGKDLDTLERDSVQLNSYFATMADLASKKNAHKISSRVRFMLQDLIELRENNWVPRRNETKPQTMQQIQIEAESEKFSIGPIKKDIKCDTDNMKKEHSSLVMPQKPYRSNYPFDKQKILQLRDDKSDFKLSPCNVWNQGSNNKSVDQNKPLYTVPSNKITPKEINEIIQDFVPGLTRRPRIREPHEDEALDLANMMGLNRYENSLKTDSLSKNEKMKRAKCKISIEEYYCNKDLKELLLTKELCSVSDTEHCLFAIELGVSKASVDYHMFIADVIIESLSKNDNKTEIICDALVKYFLSAIENDFYTDTPRLFQYLAEIIAPFLEQDIITFKDLFVTIQCLKSEKFDGEDKSYALKLVGEILKVLGYYKGPHWVFNKWIASNSTLAELSDDNVSNKYPYFFVTNMKMADFNDVLPFDYANDDFILRIQKIILSHASHTCFNKCVGTDIANWLRGNFGPVDTFSDVFVRSFSTSIFELILKTKSDDKEFSRYVNVYRILKLDKNQQLQVLKAISLLMHQLDVSQSLLIDYFRRMQADNVISSAAFIVWGNSEKTEDKNSNLKEATPGSKKSDGHKHSEQEE